jgi:hypothetical protein
LSSRISWIFIYPLPIILSAWLFRIDPITPDEMLAIALAMLGLYALYELGYMDNDTRTVLVEQSPTERLSDGEKQFFADRFWVIRGLRLLFIAVCVLAVVWLVEGNRAGKLGYIAALLVIALVFPLYNTFRGKACLPLHFLLVVCRFSAPGMVLVDWGHLHYLVTMTLLFPLINLVERSGEPRYGLSEMLVFYERRDVFRVFYYAVLVALGGVAWKVGWLDLAPVLLFTWFLVYRTISYLLRVSTRGST